MPHTVSHARAPVSVLRRRLLAAAAALAAGIAPFARADSIPLRDAWLRVDDGEVLLSVEFAVTLTPTLVEALDQGIALYFTIDFELAHPRPLWFDEKIGEWSLTWRVSWNPLTRQYRVANGPLGQAFDSLSDVERFIGRLNARRVLDARKLSPNVRYVASIRERLDVNLLPKPFQVSALASHEWQLSSDWHRFDFVP
ncbi:MAG: DUF4390 domain-containing protein [Proteobacteria bacterium]|nr:DUF4390 domain-containing protein [Pseudomonadota bacterium]